MDILKNGMEVPWTGVLVRAAQSARGAEALAPTAQSTLVLEELRGERVLLREIVTGKDTGHAAPLKPFEVLLNDVLLAVAPPM